MSVKMIPINGRLWSINANGDKNDCIALRLYGRDAHTIEISFPFHEDTPNFELTVPEALDLRNAIDQLVSIKLLEKPKEDN